MLHKHKFPFWYLSLPVGSAKRMRTFALFLTTMASSFTVCRLHMRGRILSKRYCSSALSSAEKIECKSLHALQVERQDQAEKSVLISCQSRTSEKKFLKFLSKHGDIKKYFFYESYGVYAVVEFASRDSVSSLLESATIPSISQESIVPFKSRLLSIRNLSSVNQQLNRKHLGFLLLGCVEQQILSLTKAYQLTEENSRLRFLVCSLLKDIAAAYFPECTIRPFGSSVNGFGKLGCDLDMFLDLDSISGVCLQPKSGFSLEYQMKRVNSERAITQSVLSVIGECVDQFGPGCAGVQKILNARCPLVRFSHQPSGFQCDLTANNRVAMKSTELLYLYGELDPRVRSLVFTIRSWARSHGITSSIPGAWITNFSLTIMVLFFLQRRGPPIIPTLDHLRDLAGPEDRSMIEGSDCTFVRDFSKIQLQNNTETLEQLLCEFFEFYATFPFSRMSINIRKGKEQNKPEMSPLHIQNPFETSLNVSKNVNSTQLDRFMALCQESSWLLQQNKTSTPNNTPTPWGLATLLLPSQVAGIKSGKKRRREPASERIKSLLESLKKQNQEKTG
uniref:Mitochondrial poly(A) polymerase n=1 Tax=Kryptolebias marmoratus TaxID=37003 RepID=A0A3Q3AUX7_KRYMA